MKNEFSIIPIAPIHKIRVKKLFIDHWGADFSITRGQVHYIDNLNGFVAMDTDDILGMVTYNYQNDEMELISLNSFSPEHGIGTALLNAVIAIAKHQNIKRLWLVTTNDNLIALKFYQKRNWTMSAIHINAVNKARKIKTSIPKLGYYNIPILHEIEFEYQFE